MNELLKDKLEKLLEEKIYLLDTNIKLFDDWLFSALQSEDTHIRQTAKFYYVSHPEELDDFIFDLIKERGKENITEKDIGVQKLDDMQNEVELNKIFFKMIQEKDKYKNDVRQLYKSILNRYPDNSELIHYSNMLKYNIVNIEKIEEILKNSDDYKRKENKNKIRSNEQQIGKNREKNMTIDIDEYRKATESNDDYYIDIINKAYNEVLQRPDGKADDDGLATYLPHMRNGMTEEKLRQILRNSPEYRQNFGIYQESKPIQKTAAQIVIEAPKIIYCMMGTNRLIEIKPYVESVLPYVDKFIFIDGGSKDDTINYLNSLNKEKVEVYVHPWQDRFSEQRNNYLVKLKERNYNGWVITSDTDEHFPPESLITIKNKVLEIDRKGFNGIQVQVVDVTVDDDDFNKEINRNLNQYWKPLIFKFNTNIRYEGEPHETLTGVPIKWYRSDIKYEHKRSKLHIFQRAVENFFISNSNRYSEKWAEFRFLCTKNNILSFKEFWDLFEKYKLPKEVEDWIHGHRADNADSGDSEVREMAQLYFEILPNKQKEKQKEIKLNGPLTESVQSPLVAKKTELAKMQNEKIEIPEEAKDRIMNIVIRTLEGEGGLIPSDNIYVIDIKKDVIEILENHRGEAIYRKINRG